MEKLKKISIIVQARLNSSRLPNKVIKKIDNKNAIQIIYENLSKIKEVSNLIFAIPNDKKNQKLKYYLEKKKIPYFLGSNSNVLERYYYCAKKLKSDVIIRITADCPFADPSLIKNFLYKFSNSKVDYLSNTIFPTYPDGFDIEIFNFKTLEKTFKLARSLHDKEHVTPFIKNHPNYFKLKNLIFKKNLSKWRLTLDTEQDLLRIKNVFKKLKNKKKNFSNILKLFQKNSEYLTKETNRKFWGTVDQSKLKILKANEYIPNGNMFYSKSRSFFSENFWPTYFSKTKGVYIWGLDGKKYLDYCHMGVGTNILGYSNNVIDRVVKNVVKDGNLSTLNCPEEVELCEKLVSMHDWADQAKIARTGGEANSVAVRIARCNTNKKKLAICGYHGWHDWYLSANLSSKDNLNNHLAKKLNTLGIPKQLRNTVYTFDYNDFEGLKKLVSNDSEIGIIKLEVERDQKPKNNFLRKVKELCVKKNLILIFDECTSGFRETYGGLHLKYNVNPDIAIFGKALGNGYAITAILGTHKVMKKSQNSFMSSTFWSERIGPAAALATLEEMKKQKSWRHISKFGKIIKKNILQIAKKNKLRIYFSGLDSLIKFNFRLDNSEFYYKFITEEMLKSGILAKNLIYVSIKHNKGNLKKYIKNLDKIFNKIHHMEKQKIKLNDL